MKRLVRGEFYGETNRTILLDGLTLTDTVYTHDQVDWHYHEHAYFTFILEGAVVEGNKKETYECLPGALLYHNWEEAHYNRKPPGFTRGFHIEIEKKWLDDAGLADCGQGSMQLGDPSLKLQMYKIVAETIMGASSSTLAIETLLLELLATMEGLSDRQPAGKPAWVAQLTQILQDEPDEPRTLGALASILGIHPVHLSREFPRYFHCSMGAYQRRLKVVRSLALLADRSNSLAAIAYQCGFADQSHFIRCFREFNGASPLLYRRELFG